MRFNSVFNGLNLVDTMPRSFVDRYACCEWMDQVEGLKRMKIVGWRAKVEDRQEWKRIVEQTETHPGL